MKGNPSGNSKSDAIVGIALVVSIIALVLALGRQFLLAVM